MTLLSSAKAEFTVRRLRCCGSNGSDVLPLTTMPSKWSASSMSYCNSQAASTGPWAVASNAISLLLALLPVSISGQTLEAAGKTCTSNGTSKWSFTTSVRVDHNQLRYGVANLFHPTACPCTDRGVQLLPGCSEDRRSQAAIAHVPRPRWATVQDQRRASKICGINHVAAAHDDLVI